jgi:hypothetical protein
MILLETKKPTQLVLWWVMSCERILDQLTDAPTPARRQQQQQHAVRVEARIVVMTRRFF